MNGRELIIYILENGLENESIFSDEFLRFMPTIEKVAVMFNVGVATVQVWVDEGRLDSIEVNDQIYITQTSLNKFAEEKGRKEADDAK
jgi:hypothetical protein